MDSNNLQMNTVEVLEGCGLRPAGRPKKYITEAQQRQAKELRRLKNTEAVRRLRARRHQHLRAVEPTTTNPIGTEDILRTEAVLRQSIPASTSLLETSNTPTITELINPDPLILNQLLPSASGSSTIPLYPTLDVQQLPIHADQGPPQNSNNGTSNETEEINPGPVFCHSTRQQSSDRLLHQNRNVTSMDSTYLNEITDDILISTAHPHAVLERNTSHSGPNEVKEVVVAIMPQAKPCTILNQLQSKSEANHNLSIVDLTEIPDDSDVDDISILNNQTPNDNGTSPTTTNQDFVRDISSCVSTTPTDEDSDEDVGNQASRATTEDACDEDIEPMDKAIEFLARQLLWGHGCDVEDHESMDDRLLADLALEKEEHHANGVGLEHTTTSLPSLAREAIAHISNTYNVLSTEAAIKGTEPVHRLLEPNGKDTDFVPLSPDLCQQVFEGTTLIDQDDNDSGFKKTVLWHQPYTMTQRKGRIVHGSHISYDIDSLIAVPISLGVAKRGMKICFYAPRVLNINSNIHLSTSVPFGNELKSVSYHKIPHVYLGHLCHFEDCKVYVFFPDLYCADSERTFLTDNEYSRFTNVLLQAIHEQYTSDITQHLPTTWEEAALKGKARASEQGVKLQKLEPRIQMLHYTLPPNCLKQVWNKVVEKIKLPGFQDLGTPILLLDAKNTKTLFRSHSPSTVVRQFVDAWKFAVDERSLRLHKTWVDIGKEVVSSNSELTDACTYLWRDCCLRKTLHAFQLGIPKVGFQAQFYPWALTEASSNMTFTPGKRHPLTLSGLVYSQFYASMKGIFEAAKVFPFDNANLEALAVDPNLHKLWSLEGAQGNTTWDRKRLLNAYISSKERVNEVLSASKCKRYGTREEHRVSWALLAKLGDVLLDMDEVPFLDAMNPPFQVILTADMMQFIASNVKKFGYGFEYSLVKDGGKYISSEATKMATMFLQLLRVSLGGASLQRNSALWIDIGRERFDGSEPRQGIGLSTTISTMHYGFIQNGKIDWKAWQFKPAITQNILFTHNALRSKYRTHLAQIDYSSQIQNTSVELMRWLMEIWMCTDAAWSFKHKFDAISTVWYWMAETLIWVFEMEVLTTLEKDGVLELERAEDGSIDPNSVRFCLDDLVCHLDCPIDWGTHKGKTALERLLHLWAFDDGMTRQGWEDKKYRVLYKTLVATWNTGFGEQASWTWRDVEFLKHFVRKCWMWPNANTTKWWSKSKTSKQRQWQGLSITALWFATPSRWFLTGIGDAKPHVPDAIATDIIFMSSQELIAEITSTAGSMRCVGHQLVYQLRWTWPLAIQRRQLPTSKICVFSGTAITQSSLCQTANELVQFNSVWNTPGIKAKILRDIRDVFCRERGYIQGSEPSGEREARWAELMETDKLAAELMEETLSGDRYEAICKLAERLRRPKKRKISFNM